MVVSSLFLLKEFWTWGWGRERIGREWEEANVCLVLEVEDLEKLAPQLLLDF